MDTDIKDFASIGIGFSLYFYTIQTLTKFLAVVLLLELLFMLLNRFLNFDILYELLFWVLTGGVYVIRTAIREFYIKIKRLHQSEIEDYSLQIFNLPETSIMRTKNLLNELFLGLNFRNAICYEIFEFSFAFVTVDYMRLER